MIHTAFLLPRSFSIWNLGLLEKVSLTLSVSVHANHTYGVIQLDAWTRHRLHERKSLTIFLKHLLKVFQWNSHAHRILTGISFWSWKTLHYLLQTTILMSKLWTHSPNLWGMLLWVEPSLQNHFSSGGTPACFFSSRRRKLCSRGAEGGTSAVWSLMSTQLDYFKIDIQSFHTLGSQTQESLSQTFSRYVHPVKLFSDFVLVS